MSLERELEVKSLDSAVKEILDGVDTEIIPDPEEPSEAAEDAAEKSVNESTSPDENGEALGSEAGAEQPKADGEDKLEPETIDQEIEENLNREVTKAMVSEKGVVADNFGEIPENPVTEEEADEFNDKEGVRIVYGFTGEEVSKALKVFQKNTIYKKNMIFTAIIVVLFVSYLLEMVKRPDSNLAMFMCVLTVAVLGLIWYFPLNHIRQTVKAINKQEYVEEYILTVYDNAVIIGEGESRNVFYYKENNLRIWELSDMYVLGYQKVRIFVVPKRCCQGQEELLSQLFRDGLMDKYKMAY